MKDTYFLKHADTGHIAVLAYLSPNFGYTRVSPDFAIAPANDAIPRYLLNRIEVARGTEKGQGWGTKLLQQICAEADQEQVELLLGVSPDDDSYFWPLARWYAKFGFRRFRSQLNPAFNTMLRIPKDRT